MGIRLTSNTGTVGEAAIRLAVQNWNELQDQLGGRPELQEIAPGRYRVQEMLPPSPDAREQAVLWVRERLSSFVSVFRPRIRAAVEQLRDQS